MSGKPEADISELTQLMFVGLMGAYKEVEKVLKDFHDKKDKPSHGFLFIESLVHRPLHGKSDINEKIWVFSPFPHRIMRHSLFKTDKEIFIKEILIRLDCSIFTQQMLERWKKDKHKCSYLDFEKLDKIFIDTQEFNNLFFALLKKEIEEILTDKIKIINTVARANYASYEKSKEGLMKLNSLLESLRSLHLGVDEPMTALLIPIASSQIFYGDLFVCIPQFKLRNDTEEHKKEDTNVFMQLASDLIKCVKEHYVPALALIHEHFFEKKIEKEFKEEHVIIKALNNFDAEDKKNIKLLRGEEGRKNPICRQSDETKTCYYCDYFGWEQSSDNVVEKYLHKLWQDRFTGRTYIKESLFFKKRLYTDPKILGLLENFLKPSKAKLKKDEDKVPSVLVEAEAGAGKEDIPKLLQLFSDCYNRGKPYKFNMAAIKPDAVTPVAMVGGEITCEEINNKLYGWWRHNRDETYKLKGILREIREDTRRKFEDFVSGKDGKSLAEKTSEYKEGLKSIIEKKLRDLGNGLITLNIKDFLNNENLKLEDLYDSLKNNNISLDKLNSYQIRNLKLVNYLLCEKINIESLMKENLKDANELVKKLNSEQKLIVKKVFGKFPTIVLDELNSMGIESQGVLLRFLEQAEITPIGGIEDKMNVDDEVDKAYQEFITDFLIVGLMNEDPEEITREEAVRFLKKESYIGGLLGDLLYEHILRIRRLRPDLRARMMRNGKFKMPKLADHRADIPHTFYRIINDTKKEAYFPNSEIRITMDALEYLMKPALEWNENFRLLEALVNKVVEIIYEDYKNKTEITPIDKKELIIIREKHIKKAMKEIGMEKEEKSRETPV